jgi:hypothetical protein
VGGDRPVVEGRRPAGRSIHQLVADDEFTGLDVRLERSHRGRPDHALHTELLERPHVRAVGHHVRGKLVLDPVARHERHPLLTDGPDGHRRRRIAERSVDRNLVDVFEERVQTGTAEHTDADGFRPVTRAQADFSLVPVAGAAFLSPEPDPGPVSLPEEVVSFAPDDSSLLDEPESDVEALRRRESVA